MTNYAPIGEYHLRVFLRENLSCLYKLYPIKTIYHILYECRRYNKYWNLSRSMLSHLVTFLKFNPGAFSFHKAITVKFTNSGLSFSLFYFHFYFYSVLFFYSLFLEQLGLGLIGHAVTSVTT